MSLMPDLDVLCEEYRRVLREIVRLTEHRTLLLDDIVVSVNELAAGALANIAEEQ